MELQIQRQYSLIYSFFKTTTEPFTDLDWDGETLCVYFNDLKVEKYTYRDLENLIEFL